MEARNVPVPLERLLAHREWIRRVARSLVSDADLAGDLEQDLWVETLERTPRVRGSLRGWLAAVLRNDLLNRRRADARRVRRETAAARPEAEPSTADLVAEADIHRRVVNAVMSLEEPYRSTILLRYFEDLPSTAIAARQGVPVETVRTRLKRAVVALRGSLGPGNGSDRAALVLLLDPLTRSAPPAVPGTAALAKGALIVKASTKVAIAAALLLTAGLCWWTLSPGPATAPPTSAPSPAPGVATRPTEVASAPPSVPEPGPAPVAPPAPAPAPPPAPEVGPVAVPPPAPEAEPLKPVALRGEVGGRVLLLSDRSPVEGASVTLRAEGRPAEGAEPIEPKVLTTDSSGGFRFAGVPPGAYLVAVSKEGFAPRSLGGIAVSEARGAESLEALLTRGGGLGGRVTGIGGTPMADIQVRARSQDPPYASSSVKTDADGRYAFEHLVPGKFTVDVDRGSGTAQTAYLTVPEGETLQRDFGAAGAVSGILLDGEGVPIPGAIVRASPPPDRKFESLQATTDETGRFRIEDLGPGEWRLTAQILGDRDPAVIAERGMGGFAAEVGKVVITWGDQAVTLRLEAGEIAGRVTVKATGGPLAFPAVGLSLYRLEKRGAEWSLSNSSAFASALKDGSFRFRGLAAGRYRIYAHPQDKKTLRSFERDLDLGPGEHKEGIDIALEGARTGVVRFVVRDPDGNPVEGLDFAVSKGSVSSSLRVSSPVPGTYEADFEVGSHEVNLYREDLQFKKVTVVAKEGETARVDVAMEWGGTDVTSRAASGEVAGRVFARASGKPLSSREVHVTLYQVKPWKTAGMVTLRDDGKFRFRGVAPGNYRLFVTPVKPVFRKVEKDLDMPSRGNLEGIDVGLEDCGSGTVRFLVRDPSGKPVEGANLSIVRGSTSSGIQSTCPEPGLYVAEMEEGSHTVSAYLVEVGVGRATVVVKDGKTVEVRIDLKPLPKK